MTRSSETTTPDLENLSDKKQKLLELMLAERQAERRKKEGEDAFPEADRSKPLPLSYVQKRLWFLSRLDASSPAYNIPAAVYLVGPLDADKLAEAYRRTIDRHEDLRTNFRTNKAGEPYAVVTPERPLPMPVIDLSRLPLEDAEEIAQQLVPVVSLEPFDIEKDPLLRLFLVRLAPQAHVLLLVVHHIIADVWSIGVFFHDVGAFYDALATGAEPKLPPLPLQYADYVVWQRQKLEDTGELDRQLEYWVKKLGDARPVIDVPTDFPRPPRQTVRGQRYAMHLGGDVHKRLLEIAKPEEASLYMAALTVFYILLYRYTGQNDLLVGTPTANRPRVELESLVGFFVNTVVLRGRLEGDPTFRQLLGQVRETCLEAFSHQELPFDRVVNALKLERDLSRNPLYQVDFAFQNLPSVDLETPGLELKPFTLRETTSRFDLEFDLKEAEDGFDGFIRYNSALFERSTIERMTRHYRVLLEAVLEHPDRPISSLAMLEEAEAAHLRTAWNDTADSLLADNLLADNLLADAAAKDPEATAVVGPDGESLTFAELEARSNRLARFLIDRGTVPGEIVAIAAPRRIEVAVAILAVWRAGAAYLPLDTEHPAARLAFQLEDAGVRHVLTMTELGASGLGESLDVLAAGEREVIRLDDLPADVETLSADAPERPELGDAAGESAAYVIYTSGSTGRPKGVVVTHGGLVNYLDGARRTYHLDEGTGSLVHSSLAFDLTVTGLLAPLAAGRPVRFVAEDEGLDALAAALREAEDLSVLKITPAHLDSLGRLLRPEELAGRARAFVIGGEALHHETLAPWREQAPETRLINEYGPTETVVGCSIYEVGGGNGNDAAAKATGGAVAIGWPFQNTVLHVVDPRLQLTPLGVPGELLIGGAGVARGYLGRPGLTAERFVPDPFSEKPGARLYRSGDRVRRRGGGALTEGCLEFLGRLDHQVKVRGYRIELGEIEAVLADQEGVQSAAVLARDDVPGGATALVAYVAAPKARNLGEEALRDALTGELPTYMVPSFFVFLPSLPLTVNGKIDRDALPAPEGATSRDADYVAPRTPAETQIARIWAEILEVDRVSVNDRFFDLGGQSMLAVQVVSRVRDALQVELPVQSLFEDTTVATLAAQADAAVDRGAVADAPPIVPVPRDRDLPLSFAQERLWFIDRLMPGLPAYHIPGAVRMRGELDREALERALNTIIDRHEVLRTTFEDKNGRPLQVIHPEMPLEIASVDLRELPEEERLGRALEIAREAVAVPFDLTRGPLLRTGLVELGEDDRLFYIVIHHIVYDMWSRDIFLGELVTLYEALSEGRGSLLPPLAVQYADFATWQRDWLSGEVLEEQLDFWRRELAGIETLELPTDRPRPPVPSLEGARYAHDLPPALTRQLKKLARRQKVTVYVTFLAVFYALLARLTGRRDLVIGSPIANRNRTEIESLMGFFANTLVLRAELLPGMTGQELLARTSRHSLDAFAHQDLAFEKLVAEIQPDRDLSRQPLFQVMFNFLINYEPPTMRLPKITLEAETLPTGGVAFDFVLSMYEADGTFHMMVDYATDLFDEATVARYVGYYERLLVGLTKSPKTPVERLEILDEAERRQVLVEWNEGAAETPGTAADETGPSLLHELVLRHAEATPEAVAVRDLASGTCLSYGEIAGRSARLAGRLRALGVGPESIVGVALERGTALPVALLGVLRAGATYLPLEPSQPAERLAFMAGDAGAEALVAAGELVRPEALPEPLADLPVLRLDDAGAGEDGEGDADGDLDVDLVPENAAYMIYTSGSTGQPKGVVISHRAIVDHMHWVEETFPLTPGDRFLQKTPMGFDASVWEILAPLTAGATLVTAPAEAHRDADSLASAISEGEINVLQLVPSQLRLLADADRLAGLPTLKRVFCGGEAFPRGLAERLLEAMEVEVWNLYGPTEASINATAARVDLATISGSTIPLGRPRLGSQVFVVDGIGEPVPAGIPGELWLGGPGLARGYTGRPARTAAQFIPDPFGEEEGARLYRTGDLGRWLPSGELEFLGRIDHQVKLRGHRIELGEIEAVLESHTEVREAVARIAGEDDRALLVAWIAPVEGAAPEGEEAAAELGDTLRAFLRERLPESMVPAAVGVLDELPRTSSGKLDRRALAELDPGIGAGRELVAPRTPKEEAVAAIWAEVLGRPEIGVETSFFDLGGHSLLVTQVVARVNAEFGVDLPLRQLFDAPTVAELTRAVERLEWVAAGAAAADTAADEPLGEDEEEGEL